MEEILNVTTTIGAEGIHESQQMQYSSRGWLAKRKEPEKENF